MTEKHRVLVVDDHKEVRTTFRANLEALEAELDVVDVPSGEEAILEAAGNQVDLLIADVGLPGLSGLELLEKIKIHNPEMKIILITGLEDEDIRRKVADAGTDAFFLKPVKIPDLLKAVTRCIGLDVDTTDGEDLEPLQVELLGEEVAERVADLRGELGAISVVLLSEERKIVAKSGGLPDAVYETHVIPQLMNTFQSVNEISSFLGLDRPKSNWYFSGAKYDLFWTHVGRAHGMLVVTNPILQNTDITWVMATLDLAAKETLKIINKMADSESGQEKPLPNAATDEGDEGDAEAHSQAEEPGGLPEEESPDFMDLESELERDEAASFWESATLEEDGFENPDGLTFEEAQKLGFIPEENDMGV
ncbi:MAG: response regulator [Anaerolineales bacterium]